MNAAGARGGIPKARGGVCDSWGHQRQWTQSMVEFTSRLDEAPNAPGSYALIVHVGAPTPARIGRLGLFTLLEGDYVYCGSARGPGGLRARLRRHGLRDKPHHWHIDYLTGFASTLGAFYQVGGLQLECSWARMVCTMPEATCPVPGFGSSDCRCATHLASFESGDAKHLLASVLNHRLA